MKKTCSGCKLELTIDRFYLRKDRKNLYNPKCKDCVKKQSAESHKITSYDVCPCGKKKDKRSKQCFFCVETSFLSKTKSESEYFKAHNRASRYCTIREHARKIAKKLGIDKKGCAKCGYSKHVQICHIKSIKEFSDDSKVSEINDENNLIQLCPNCHWEFDHPTTEG